MRILNNGDPTDPKKPATRQDSLDLYNSSVALKQALIDQGYLLSNIINRDYKIKKERVLTSSEEEELVKNYKELKAIGLQDENREAREAKSVKNNDYRDSLKEKYNIDWLPSVNEGDGLSFKNRGSHVWNGDVLEEDTSFRSMIPNLEYKEDRVVYPLQNVSHQEYQDHLYKQDPDNAQREDLNEHQYLQRESANKVINEDLPKGMYDSRIKPKATMSWKKDIGNWYGGENIDVVDFPDYDNVQNKPWDLLTPVEKQKRKSMEGGTGYNYQNRKEAAEKQMTQLKAQREKNSNANDNSSTTNPPKTRLFKTLKKSSNSPLKAKEEEQPKPIKDPVYGTGGENGIYTMPTFSTGRSKEFTGVQTTDDSGGRIRTDIKDLPEYIRNDKIFKQLIERSTSAYKNASQKDRYNMSGSNKDSKDLEDIMTGKTTLEEYKKRNIRVEFSSGGRVNILSR